VNKAAPRCLGCGSSNTTPWCTATDAEYFTTDDPFRYFACADCEVLFIDPVPRDRLAEIYPSNYYSFSTPKKSFVVRVKDWLDNRVFVKLLRSLPGSELNLLDVGGGAGWQLSGLRALDPRVKLTQVVDLDPAAATLARENGHEYFCGRIETFETDRKFDLVLMLNIIEHLDDPTAVLVKVRELLSPNGVVLIKTPNYDSLDARIFRDGNWAGYHCPRHWILFTRESLLAKVAAAGLATTSFWYTQGAPFWAGSALFWLKKRGWVQITRERPVVYHPLFGLFSAIFAGVDFVRKPFAKTSQMFVMLRRQEDGDGAVTKQE
jgi:2-polyprenyl-3-methyl-5-hydroxy-6-metoxy-1,4-benzoquinol methylase